MENVVWSRSSTRENLRDPCHHPIWIQGCGWIFQKTKCRPAGLFFVSTKEIPLVAILKTFQRFLDALAMMMTFNKVVNNLPYHTPVILVMDNATSHCSIFCNLVPGGSLDLMKYNFLYLVKTIPTHSDIFFVSKKMSAPGLTH